MFVFALMGHNGVTWFLDSIHFLSSHAEQRRDKEVLQHPDFTYKINEVEVEV